MATNFEPTLTKQFLGYESRQEITNSDPAFLVQGSQNMLVDWQGSLVSRNGNVIQGDAGTLGNGTRGAFTWRTSRGDVYVLRRWGTRLEVRLSETVSGVTTYSWHAISTALVNCGSEVISEFATVWDDTNKIDKLIFPSFAKGITEWSGALIEVASVTSNTITKTGTRTFGSHGFPATGSIVINGVSYAYTGGAGTTTLTGVTPNPVGSVVAGDVGTASITTTTSSAPTHPWDATFTIDFVGAFRNQLYVGNKKSRVAYCSDALSYLDFTSSSDVGGARMFVLDDTCAGFMATKDSMLIFGQTDMVMTIKFTVSADQTKELMQITRLETGSQGGVITPSAKIRIKNAVMYITKEKTLDTIEFVANIADEQTLPISDIVKRDFDSFDFTDATITYWDRLIVVIIPLSNTIMLYDVARKMWHAPISFANTTIGCASVDENGNLIGHDYYKNESYQLFTGRNDNGTAFNTKAVFAYNNFGSRFGVKKLYKYAQDGYISSNGQLKRVLDYNFMGQTKTIEKTFKGNEKYAYQIDDESTFGKTPLGSRTLAGESEVTQEDERRFRYIDNITPTEFYELLVTYQMTDVLDGFWRLVAHGGNVTLTASEPNNITRS
jgi:hypothetical protein